MIAAPEITRREVLGRLAPYRRPRTGLAIALVAFDLCAFATLWTALLLAADWNWQIPLAIACAFGIMRLFTIGHDACHGSYLPWGWANELLGRVVFLPSYTPFTTWELGHNSLHHGFTNLRGRDYVWAPFSPSEFAGLPVWRRRLERMYRSPLGPALYYLIEIWWRKLMFPRRREVELFRPVYRWDSLLAALFFAAQCVAVAGASARTGQHPLLLGLFALVIPFAGWNWLMGFAILLHHTGPHVVWPQSRHEWDPLAAQVENTLHVVFPRWFDRLTNNIMQHTAHHLDVKIPMFSLTAAQRAVEEMFPGQVTVVRWSWSYYLDCCRRCQLYDYDRRRWLDFSGNPH